MIEPFVCHGCSTSRKSFEAQCSHCGSERPKGGWALHPHIGDLVADRYRILSALGRGSSGDVYLARDARMHAEAGDVVVKIFSGTLSPNLERRFQNEVRAARRIDNRHCVAVFDAGTHRGAPYLVMERVHGRNLRQWLGGRPRLDAAEVIELFEQVAEALVDVHAQGIVHRDLKPENLMVVREAPLFVKVLDFGVAHLADDGATLSGVGTPRYMAPEQALHEPVDARTDIYALGATVFELLAGAPPFTGDSVSELLRAKQERAAPALLDVAPSVPPHLARLVDAMIRRAPAERPDDMNDVLRRLRQPDSEPEPRSPPPRRRGRAIAVAGLSLALLAVLVHSAAMRTADPAPVTHADAGAPPTVSVAAAPPAPAGDGPSRLADASLAALPPEPRVRSPLPVAPARERAPATSVSSAAPAVTFRSGGLKATEL